MLKSILNNDDLNSENRLQIIDVQENERKRIARDLHDTTLQSITHVIHQIELSELQMDKDPVGVKLELMSARQNLKNVISEIRNLIFDLRPMSFDDLGLKETFENFIDIIKVYSHFEVTSEIDDIEGNDYLLISVYRIAREALMNALKHSGGNKIHFVCKESKNTLDIIVEDNGCGFSEENLQNCNHYGLDVMKERVNLLKGSMKIIFDNGTKIVVNIPVAKY
jgi:two-component system sensor histidine kinase DegS